MKRYLRLLLATAIAIVVLCLGAVTAFGAQEYDSIDAAISSMDSGSIGQNMVINGIGDFKYVGEIEDHSLYGTVDITEDTVSVAYHAGDGAIFVDQNQPKIIFYNATVEDLKLFYSISDPTVIELYGNNKITNDSDAGFYNDGSANITIRGDGTLTIDAIDGFRSPDPCTFYNERTGNLNLSVVTVDPLGSSGKTEAYYTIYGDCTLRIHPSQGNVPFYLGEIASEITYIYLEDSAILTIPKGTVLDYGNTLNASLDKFTAYIHAGADAQLIVNGELWLPPATSDDLVDTELKEIVEDLGIGGSGDIKVPSVSNPEKSITYYVPKGKTDVSIAKEAAAKAAADAKAKAAFQKKTTTIKLKSHKKAATVSWKKVSGAKGYQIYRSTKKSKGYKLVKTVKSGSTVKYKNTKLKKKKRYYYKVRPYTVINGKTVYGKFSKVKSVKTK